MAHVQVEPRTEIGKRLEKELENRDLNREQAPLAIGISKPTYLALMRYIPDMRRATVQKLADFLGVDYMQVRIWLEDDIRKGGYVALFSQPIPLAA